MKQREGGEDIEAWWPTFTEAFLTLLVILDPPAALPVFLALTGEFEAGFRRRAAYVSIAVAAAVLTLFAVAGPVLFRCLSISVESLMIAGGLLLLTVAFQMFLRGPQLEPTTTSLNPAYVPIGTPLLAGPGAIVATLLLFEDPGVLHHGAVATGIAAALVVTLIVLRFAASCARCFRPGLVQFSTRVMGLLLAAFAVQMGVDAIARWQRFGMD